MLERSETTFSHAGHGNRCWRSCSTTIVACLVVVGLAGGRATGNDAPKSDVAASKDAGTAPIEHPFSNRFKAPSLDGGTAWLNTSGEITLKDLRGKIVLLDFWTYCCINCMHVLPDLEFLERKYHKELVVIGVHSAKFDTEKDSDSIRQAIMRYEIEHPVINDSQMIVWRKMKVNSWPTLVLIDAEGKYCGYVSGEGNRDVLDAVIARLVTYHKATKTLDTTPIRFDLERDKQAPTPLKHPGKVLADEEIDRLFISDSNHNRIVICTLDGELVDIVGNGAIGSNDGSYRQATFDHPQGMERVGDILYVTDTENHLLRAINLKNQVVSTLAGTGQQARFRASGGKLRETALNSPWALQHVDDTLFVAMAGPHQIWSHRLGSQTIQVFAGSGREDIIDGSATEAALAQPSGLTTDGRFLYVADSEGSSIRQISLGPHPKVSTLVGTSNLPNARLFTFGDRDGRFDQALLQHPLGVVYHDSVVYVADSYNHKVKAIDTKRRTVETVLGTGQVGKRFAPTEFSEPEGLSVAEGKLYIADTNNHRVCVADLKTLEVSELRIAGLGPPKLSTSEDSDFALAQSPAILTLDLQQVAAAESVAFRITLKLSEGYELNKMSPVRYKLKSRGVQDLIATGNLDTGHKAQVDGSIVDFQVPLTGKSGKGTFEVALTYTYCRDGVGGLCKFKTARWLVPLEVGSDATKRLISLQVAPVD